MRSGFILTSSMVLLSLCAATAVFSAKPNSASKRSDATQWTPLYHAAFEGDLETVKTLLAGGAAVDEQSGEVEGNTPLIAAAFGGYYEVALALIEKGADPNAQNIYGSTAFIAAARSSVRFEARRKRWSHQGVNLADSGYGYVAVMDYLVSKGANPRIVSKNGHSALDIPVLAGNESIARYVVSTGVRPTKRDKRFWRESIEGLSPYQIETFRKKENLDTFHPDETRRLAELVEDLADELAVEKMPEPQKTPTTAAPQPNTPDSSAPSDKPTSRIAIDKAANCAKLVAASKVCEKLPFPFNAGCKITAKANFANDLCRIK